LWRDAGHHVVGIKDIECQTDTEATEEAKQFVDGHAIEVYERGRFITCFQSQDKK
jgi:hypothetical protein